MFIMREMTEAVRNGEEEAGDLIVHVVDAANGEDFVERQIRDVTLLQGETDIGKTFRHGATHFGQFGGDAGDGAFEFFDAFAVTVRVGLAIHKEEVHDGFFAEEVPQFLTVNIGLALLRSAVRGDDENLGARLAALDQLNPFLDEALLWTFAWLPDDEIDGGRTKEQLVCGTIDALTAEVPPVNGDFFSAIRVSDFEELDFDTMCSRKPLDKCFASQCTE